MTGKGAVVSTVAFITMRLKFAQPALYELERIRIAMKVKTKEDAIGRSFRELLEAHGITFRSESVSHDILEQLGRAATGNVTHLHMLRGTMSVFLPAPIQSDWFELMTQKTDRKDVNGLVRLALSEAVKKYC